MTLSARSIAVEGVGFGASHVAALGLWPFDVSVESGTICIRLTHRVCTNVFASSRESTWIGLHSFVSSRVAPSVSTPTIVRAEPNDVAVRVRDSLGTLVYASASGTASLVVVSHREAGHVALSHSKQTSIAVSIAADRVSLRRSQSSSVSASPSVCAVSIASRKATDVRISVSSATLVRSENG